MIVNQQSKRGFGISEILGIATVLIIAAAVVIPTQRSGKNYFRIHQNMGAGQDGNHLQFSSRKLT